MQQQLQACSGAPVDGSCFSFTDSALDSGFPSWAGGCWSLFFLGKVGGGLHPLCEKLFQFGNSRPCVARLPPASLSAAETKEAESKKRKKMATYFTLNTGARIPSVGLGTYKAGPGVVGDAIAAAIKAGYRHIDCAPLYENEKQIGVALKKVFDEGAVKREDLFITSKIWCSDLAPEDIPSAIDSTLNDLQLDYLDLYLIHWPFQVKKGSEISPENFVRFDMPKTWQAMEKLYDSGKAHAVGVSNFTTKKLADLLAIARVPPAVNQVECHPGWQQENLRAFCHSNGVHFSAYRPLGKTNIANNTVVTSIAESLGKTQAQVALRWGIQQGQSVLPKSANESRLKENIDLFGLSIPDELCAKFSEIEQVRLIRNDSFVHPQSIYKTIEELWDGEI